MLQFLSAYEARFCALLRMVAGLLFLCHGSQKLLGFPLPAHEGAPAFVTWTAGPIEFVGGILVMAGFSPARRRFSAAA